MSTTSSYGGSSTILNYKINKHQTVQLIPTLDELLFEEGCADSYYTRANFMDFLAHNHCLENVEFVVQLNGFLNHPTAQAWEQIYATFLAPDSSNEINLPHDIKRDLLSQDFPDIQKILRCKRVIYDDILFNLYNEFIRHTRAKIASDLLAAPAASASVVYRRKSEIILPDTVIRERAKRSNSTAEYYKEDIIEHEDILPTPSYLRNNSASSSSNANSTSNPSSRGSSIGLIMDSLKTNVDYMKLKNVRKFRFRRASNDTS
ncbi:uncharacterized protein CANTADRAFT_20755 [Suhomyces tanzawaensis NRRL Y-17324]|uniref:RGS domain-containing protein n=1 Tax=Suhomyces tanzawaensis NRRL Y-17324 TaxID=984487 RepID=A0A1E4SNY5_9ASCO|nr:uncharacterized protein CANTADRAFT_20755 [Suhomyces tanzawaensis NRRL Y-17324]ODV81223.1 hypothetical protein CANTADRAFT_20755 [Suhomyces tanzawaensis NRRL Y-17324]